MSEKLPTAKKEMTSREGKALKWVFGGSGGILSFLGIDTAMNQTETADTLENEVVPRLVALLENENAGEFVVFFFALVFAYYMSLYTAKKAEQHLNNAGLY